MKIFGLAGRSGSGKTTLLVRLLPELRARGLTVSTLKHAHHGFDIDRPGKDSHRHREAGASEVMVVSGDRWALLHEIREEEPPLEDLIRRMTPVDLVLVEGFHTHGHPMIEVHRPSAGHRLMWHPGSDILAVASDEPVAGCGVPLLDLNDTVAIADFVMARAELAWRNAKNSIRCTRMSMVPHGATMKLRSEATRGSSGQIDDSEWTRSTASL